MLVELRCMMIAMLTVEKIPNFRNIFLSEIYHTCGLTASYLAFTMPAIDSWFNVHDLYTLK